MTNLVKHILVFAFSVHLTFATKIGCEDDYVTANWDDDAFRYYFMPSNIEKTLYCIGFDRNKLTNDDESMTGTTLNETGTFLVRNLLSFEYLDEDYNLLYFKEIFHFWIYNEQLRINKSFYLPYQHANETIWVDIPPKYARDFLPKLVFNQWPEHEFSDLTISPSGYIYVRPFNGITKQACPIELYSYPFDKHTCEVSFVFGKFDNIYLHKLFFKYLCRFS